MNICTVLCELQFAEGSTFQVHDLNVLYLLCACSSKPTINFCVTNLCEFLRTFRAPFYFKR